MARTGVKRRPMLWAFIASTFLISQGFQEDLDQIRRPQPDLYPAMILSVDGSIYHLIRGPEAQRFFLNASLYFQDPLITEPADAVYEYVLLDPNFRNGPIDFAQISSSANSGMEKISIKKSFSELEDEWRRHHQLKKVDGPYQIPNRVESGWLNESIRVRLSARTVEKALLGLIGSFSDVGGDQRTSPVVKLMEQSLLQQVLSLDASQMDSLRRGSDNPLPRAVEFLIPLDPILVWNMHQKVQVEGIDFQIDSRKIGFKPSIDAVELKINSKKSNIWGPMSQEGFLSPFLELKWPRFQKYPLLLSGEVSRLVLQFQVGLSKEDYKLPNQEELEVWTWGKRLQDSFLILFEPDENGKKLLTMKSISKEGQEEPNIRIEPINEEWRPKIQGPLLNALSEGLGTRVPRDQLSFPIEQRLGGALSWKQLLERNSNDSGLSFSDVKMNYRLAGIDIRSDGLELILDTQVEVRDVNECVWPYFQAKDFSGDYPIDDAARIFSPSAKDETRDLEWGFEFQSGDNGWKLYRSQINQEQVPSRFFEEEQSELQIHSEVLNAYLHFFWLSGLFCRRSDEWPGRPDYIPEASIGFVTPPRIMDFGALPNQLTLGGDLEMQFLELDRSRVETLSPLEFQFDLRLDEAGEDFQFDSFYVDSEDTRSVSEAEAEALVYATKVSLSKAGLIRSRDGKLGDWLALFTEAFGIEKRQIWMGSHSIGFSSQHDTDQLISKVRELVESQDDTERALPQESELKTIIQNCPSGELYRQRSLELQWGQDSEWSEAVTYQYRWYLASEPPTEMDASWTLSDLPRYMLFLKEDGRYIFEVRALDSSRRLQEKAWQIREGKPSYPFCEINFVSEKQSPSEQTEDQWVTIDQSEKTADRASENQSSELPVFRESAKGPFGCSLRTAGR